MLTDFHSIFGHYVKKVYYPETYLLHKHYICLLMSSLVHLLPGFWIMSKWPYLRPHVSVYLKPCLLLAGNVTSTGSSTDNLAPAGVEDTGLSIIILILILFYFINFVFDIILYFSLSLLLVPPSTVAGAIQILVVMVIISACQFASLEC